jgi:hypothetical protein
VLAVTVLCVRLTVLCVPYSLGSGRGFQGLGLHRGDAVSPLEKAEGEDPREEQNMGHTRQSSPEFGLDFQGKVLEPLQGVPSSLKQCIEACRGDAVSPLEKAEEEQPCWGWSSCSTEEPLQRAIQEAAKSSSTATANNLKRFNDFYLKPGPESGLDSLSCAIFARQRRVFKSDRNAPR